MTVQSASLVRAAAFRSSALSLAKSCSIGFRSGLVGRQIEDGGAGRGDGLLDAIDLVGGEIVHHHDVAGRQRRSQHLLDVGPEGGAGHRPVEDERGDHAALPQAGDEGRGLPMMGWTPPDGIDVPRWWC